MTISVSINKDGLATLYVNDSLSSVDNIQWEELALITSEESVTCFGILGSASIGLNNYKDKAWKPDGQKALFKVYNKEKQQYDKDTSKWNTVKVHRDETHLYDLLKSVSDNYSGQILTGFVSPWINPYYWEFITSESDKARADKLDSATVALSVNNVPGKLSQSDIDAVTAAGGKKTFGGGYSKGETEVEKIASRMEFLKTQIADVCEFTTLYDLASQIESIKVGAEAKSPSQIVQDSIESTIKLIAMILGSN